MNVFCVFLTYSACVGAERHFFVYNKMLLRDVVMTIDPVCKMGVNEKKTIFKSEYKGKTYYFCSAQCKNEFEKNPEKYV
jgi:YHS domain-containing protein